MAVANAREVREVESEVNAYAIHPLVLMNVSEHHTRVNLSSAPLAPTPPGAKGAAAAVVASPPMTAATRAIGVLLGQQVGRKLEIHTSFDLKVSSVPGEAPSSCNLVVDAAYIKKKRESMARVFPDYEVVGWYTTGTSLSEHDLRATQSAVLEVAPEGMLCSVILVVNVAVTPGDKSSQLPVYLFETFKGGPDASALPKLSRVTYTIESEECERIGVETAKAVETSADTEVPTLKPQADGYRSALAMLRARINIITAYLRDVQAGSIPPDYALLRRISTIVNQMPRSDNPSFQRAFNKDYSDAMLIAYLGLLQKGTSMLGKLSTDVQEAVGSDRRGGKRAAMMMGF